MKILPNFSIDFSSFWMLSWFAIALLKKFFKYFEAFGIHANFDNTVKIQNTFKLDQSLILKQVMLQQTNIDINFWKFWF